MLPGNFQPPRPSDSLPVPVPVPVPVPETDHDHDRDTDAMTLNHKRTGLRLVSLALAVSTSAATVTPPASAQTAQTMAAPVRVLTILQHIQQTLRTSSYQHSPRIDERQGRYDFDCSAMAQWILARSAPRALATVGGARPLAVDFFRTIARAPTDRPRGGWLQVARVADARPGDVLAWRRPRWFPSRNTGHVAFVVGTPEVTENGVLLRIADASSYNHEDDSRAGGTGFGTGIILITTDPITGAGTGYGWFGRHSGEWIVPTPVAIGRPTN